FVAMASHEFRTPLATILSSLSLVSTYIEKDDTEKQIKHINRIKSSVTHLTDILNDVLSLSKLEEGGQVCSLEKVDVKKFFPQVIKEVDGIIKEGQTIVFTHTGNAEALIDKKMIRHVLLNLLSNAIKFTSEGEKIEMFTSVSNNETEIIIKDKGIGISEEDQKHLFERFFRASNATNIQGTGLGLSIVSKYVEMHNGTIACESILDEGTKFIIKLPNN
ncbi:MAG: sensor histidine kinase, partial [Bacteroidia bacterium]